MKITKTKLKQIIKEELEKSLTAVSGPSGRIHENEDNELRQLMDRGDQGLKNWLRFMSRQPLNSLEKLAKLWDGMTNKPGDIKAARALAADLGINPGAASFHARKLQSGTQYPSGDRLLNLVRAERERQKAYDLANPKPKPEPEPYGGGSRYRPYGPST